MNINNAKEIFLKYGGNFFQMERDNKYEYYKMFAITKEQEYEWINQYQKNLLTAIVNEKYVGNDFLKLSESLRITCFLENFDEFLRTIIINNYCDTFSMIRVSEEVVDIADELMAKNNANNTKVKKLINKFYEEFWMDKENAKISIDKYYFGIPYLRDLLSEDKICVRRSKIIERIKRTING